MTKLLVPLSLALTLTVATVTADLTKFDWEYDGRVITWKGTMRLVEQLVDEQKDEWLTKQFNTTMTPVEKSIDAGTASFQEVLQALNNFYDTADTKYKNFARAATNKIVDTPVDVSVVDDVFAPEAWSDYVFGQMDSIAKKSGSAELKTQLETTQKKIEDGITKRIPPKEVSAMILDLYSKSNDIYPTFLDEFTQKLDEFSAQLTKESYAVVLKKETVMPSPDSNTSSPTTAPASSLPPTTNESNSSATGNEPASSTASPTSSPSALTTAPPKSTARKTVAAGVVSMGIVAVTALAAAVW